MFLSSNGFGPLLKLVFYVFLQGGNKDAELPVTLTFWQLYSAVPEGNLKKRENKRRIYTSENDTDESCRSLTLMLEHRSPGEQDNDATVDLVEVPAMLNT